MENHLILVPILFLLVVALVISAGFYFAAQEGKQRRQWKFIAEGIYKNTIYGERFETQRSGTMVHATHTYRIKNTAIHFNDGRVYILSGWRDMPFPAGTKIKLYRNPFGDGKIEKSPES